MNNQEIIKELHREKAVEILKKRGEELCSKK